MNNYSNYLWQWGMVYYYGSGIQELGYSSLFTPGEFSRMNRGMSQKAQKYTLFSQEKKPEEKISHRMWRLMKDYHDFFTPSLNAALCQGKVTFVTPYNATGRWSYANRHGAVVVVADRTMTEDINRRIKKSGMQLRQGIQVCTADITDADSLAALWRTAGSGAPVYFSLGLLPLTATPEYTEKTLAALSQVLTTSDNLSFGFISLEGSNLPRGTPVYTPAEMASILSKNGFNIYEDGTHTAPDGTEITFFLRVKKMYR